MEELHDAIEEAHQEIKRADHLIFVSLKYTRTTDVIKSVIQRLSNTLGFLIESLLIKAEAEDKIKEIPVSPGQRAEVAKKHYQDEKIHKMVEFYLLLRKILRSQYSAEQEYRKDVTLIVDLGDDELEINLPLIHEYYEKTNDYANYVKELVS